MSLVRCCKGCKDREIGCHAICERYIKEKEEYDNIRRNEFNRRETLRGIRDVRYRNLPDKK